MHPHGLRYALYPHLGDHVVGQVVRQGYELNVPLRAVHAGSDGDGADVAPTGCSTNPILTLSEHTVVCDTVKAAEDGSGIVFRLYEHAGAQVDVNIKFGMNLSEVREVNLLEQPLPDATAGPLVLTPLDNALPGATVSLRFLPYEIKTLLVSTPAASNDVRATKRRKGC